MMDKFWLSALKTSPTLAIGGGLAYFIYPSIIASPYAKNLNHSELFWLLALIVVVTFFIALSIVNSSSSKKNSGNTISIKNSTISGSVVGGNNNPKSEK